MKNGVDKDDAPDGYIAIRMTDDCKPCDFFSTGKDCPQKEGASMCCAVDRKDKICVYFKRKKEMNDHMIAARDRHYAEEERKMAQRDEVERQEEKAERSMRIRYHSRFVNGKELHYAEIIDEDGEGIWASEDNDSLEDVIVLVRSKRDKIAHEMAEKAVKDAGQNQ